MKTTAEALELSIRHWEENAAVTDVRYAEIGIKSCALCEKFFYRECIGCPVSKETNNKYCRKTPHKEASDFQFNGDLENFKIAAQKEVEFLKSLREDVK